MVIYIPAIFIITRKFEKQYSIKNCNAPKMHENLKLFCKCHFLSFGASSNLLRSILLNYAIWYVQCTFCRMHNYFRCPIIDDLNAIHSEFVVKYMIHNVIWYIHYGYKYLPTNRIRLDSCLVSIKGCIKCKLEHCH